MRTKRPARASAPLVALVSSRSMRSMTPSNTANTGSPTVEPRSTPQWPGGGADGPGAGAAQGGAGVIGEAEGDDRRDQRVRDRQEHAGARRAAQLARAQELGDAPAQEQRRADAQREPDRQPPALAL